MILVDSASLVLSTQLAKYPSEKDKSGIDYPCEKDKSSSTQNLPKSAYLTFWKPLDL